MAKKKSKPKSRHVKLGPIGFRYKILADIRSVGYWFIFLGILFWIPMAILGLLFYIIWAIGALKMKIPKQGIRWRG